MTRGETKIKPRVFFTEFPNLVIYVREVTPGVGWTDVVVADSSTPTQPKTYLAKNGRLLLDEAKRTVQLVLDDGTHAHREARRSPRNTSSARSTQTRSSIDPESVFPRDGPMKGYTEMTIAELKARDGGARKQNIYPHNQIMAWQKKFSIPAACLAFMLIALGMGVSNRRDGRLAGLRARHRRRVRLLHADVHVGSDREGGPAALLVCVARDVGAERRRRVLGPCADREEAARRRNSRP